MNTPRLRRIERIILLASFVFSLAIGLVWFRSLLVIDELQYTPPVDLNGAAASAEWEFSSTSGALEISRFEQVPQIHRTSFPSELLDVYHNPSGWSLDANKGTVGGGIVATFLQGFKLFGWGRQEEPQIGSMLAFKFPYALPFMMALIPPAIIWIRWQKRQQSSRRGFPIESKN